MPKQSEEYKNDAQNGRTDLDYPGFKRSKRAADQILVALLHDDHQPRRLATDFDRLLRRQPPLVSLTDFRQRVAIVVARRPVVQLNHMHAVLRTIEHGAPRWAINFGKRGVLQDSPAVRLAGINQHRKTVVGRARWFSHRVARQLNEFSQLDHHPEHSQEAAAIHDRGRYDDHPPVGELADEHRRKLGDAYRLSFRDAEKRKRAIWLGKVSAAKAEEWKTHVEHLLDVASRDEPPHKATAAWISRLKDKEHRKLAGVGLVDSRAERVRQTMTLGTWLDTYIAERVDVKHSTRQTYEKGRDSLIAYFGRSKPLRSITAEDAKKWRIWLSTQGNRRDKNRADLGDATVRRRTGKAKQFFAEALERGLVDTNPFAKLQSHVTANTARQFFVPAQWIESCIVHAPDTDWRTILALARYGGLRCPSEIRRLKWTDVNLPEGRMTIHASKTEHHSTGGVRVCPIFPELRRYLEAAWDEAPEGAVYVVDHCRSPTVNLRTRFESIIKAAGLVPWPKLFQNLRASRETELMSRFPAKDVASWLGNSVPVAMAHYAMPMASSFQQAIAVSTSGLSGSKCGSIPGNAEAITTSAQPLKNPVFTEKSGVLMAAAGSVMGKQMGDTELESVTSTMSTWRSNQLS